MIKAQVTVTPAEAKRLIAKGVSAMSEVRNALEKGKVLLKGGTTVSAIAEELAGVTLTISGRITPQGTKSVREPMSPHIILIEDGKVTTAEDPKLIEEIAIQMGKNDVLIIGANAIDARRNTGIMVAAPMGGTAAKVIPGIIARGVTTIIAVGWEKLIPGTIEEAIAASGQQTTDLALGATVGLVPLFGTVVTETDAVTMLAGVKATMIGAGGVTGGEGSSTFVMAGTPASVKRAWDIVVSVKGAATSGIPESLVECSPKSTRCAAFITAGNKRIPFHHGCVYREPGLAEKVFKG